MMEVPNLLEKENVTLAVRRRFYVANRQLPAVNGKKSSHRKIDPALLCTGDPP
jgi:hypothetical protein